MKASALKMLLASAALGLAPGAAAQEGAMDVQIMKNYPSFAQADKSGDGKLNRGEAAAANLTGLMQDWERADKDDNKVLSEAEYSAYQQANPKRERAASASRGKPPMTIGKGSFSSPETAIWDEKTGTYLVSNINGGLALLDDNGFISKVLPSGEIVDLKWIDGGARDVVLHGPKGMLLTEEHLVVVDIHTVRFFDRLNGRPIKEVSIPQSYMLGDPAVMPDGTIYVTDMADEAGKHEGKIFRIEGNKTSVLAQGHHLDRPDGIVAHEGKLLVTPFAVHAKEVYEITQKGEKQAYAGMPEPQLDGLLGLPDGSLIVTSWKGREVYRVDEEGGATAIIEDLDSPAQIGYDDKNGRLLVPQLRENKMMVYDLSALTERQSSNAQ